jgi:hypothetical protein
LRGTTVIAWQIRSAASIVAALVCWQAQETRGASDDAIAAAKWRGTTFDRRQIGSLRPFHNISFEKNPCLFKGIDRSVRFFSGKINPDRYSKDRF